MAELQSVVDIQPTDRAVLVGRTGSGKSELAKALLVQYEHVIVIDEKKDFGTRYDYGRRRWIDGRLPRQVEATTPDQVQELADERARTNTVYSPIVYQPDEEYWNPAAYDEVFLTVYRRGHTTLYVDEVYSVLKGMLAPKWYRAILTRGRSLGIRTIQATQRPHRIPIEILSESEHYMMFALRHAADVDRMAELMGDEVLNPLRNEHSFYYLNIRKGGVRELILRGLVTNGRPVPERADYTNDAVRP